MSFLMYLNASVFFEIPNEYLFFIGIIVTLPTI